MAVISCWIGNSRCGMSGAGTGATVASSTPLGALGKGDIAHLIPKATAISKDLPRRHFLVPDKTA